MVAGLPVLSKAYYTTHEFDQTTLEPPLGSGPYKIGDFKPGAFVSYKRRDDYWAKDLPVNRGRYNFDEMRFEYYRDRTASSRASRPAPSICARSSPRATGSRPTTSPPSRKAGSIKLTLPDESPSGAQGFFLNTRRPKLADVRVRKALDYAFDFEWTNKNIFYGLYKRTESFFENSDMKARASRAPAELALLEPFRAQLPPEVFEEPYKSPVSDGSGQDRKLLREAGRLLDEAGWKVKDGKRVDAKGEMLELEFLIIDPDLRAHPHALRQEPAGDRYRRQHPPHRPGAVRAPRQVVRLRRRHHALRPAPDARAWRSGTSGAARRPRPTAASIWPASAIQSSMP